MEAETALESIRHLLAEPLRLDSTQVGVDENLLELGMHSLLAVQVMALIRDHLKTRIELIDPFNHYYATSPHHTLATTPISLH